jgi:hypothetical protein
MNAQQILNELYATPVQDPRVLEMAQQIEFLTKEFQAGNCSRDEYIELLGDFQTQRLIQEQCEDLAAKERLNTIVNIVVNSASVLSSV